MVALINHLLTYLLTYTLDHTRPQHLEQAVIFSPANVTTLLELLHRKIHAFEVACFKFCGDISQSIVTLHDVGDVSSMAVTD